MNNLVLEIKSVVIKKVSLVTQKKDVKNLAAIKMHNFNIITEKINV